MKTGTGTDVTVNRSISGSHIGDPLMFGRPRGHRSSDHTIGLLITGQTDRRLLEVFLQELGYRVRTGFPGGDWVEEWYDVSLVIVDDAAVRHVSTQLTRMKKFAGSVFLPFLMFYPANRPVTDWAGAGFDDVLRTPISKSELAARVDVLLRLREQSQEQHRSVFENRRARGRHRYQRQHKYRHILLILTSGRCAFVWWSN